MKCPVCGSKMNSVRKTIDYNISGLKNVRLANIDVRRCSKCGEDAIVIPDVEGLNQAIAMHLISKRNPLEPSEFRFLRKHLGYSSGDLADALGTTVETISRWEHGRYPIASEGDRALRLMVALGKKVKGYDLSDLRGIRRGKREQIVTARRVGKDKHWSMGVARAA